MTALKQADTAAGGGRGWTVKPIQDYYGTH